MNENEKTIREATPNEEQNATGQIAPEKPKKKYYTPEQHARQMKYDAKAMRNITFRFNKKTDKLLLEKLDSVPNRQGYIKALIIADMMRERMIGEDLKREDEEE